MPKGSATLDDLLKQAKITNRLLAAPLKSTMGQMALVRLLASTGATNQEIADALDTTAATVGVTLQRLKRKAASKAGVEIDADPDN
jgi:DNA-binding NarL/FixJ family response regulator